MPDENGSRQRELPLRWETLAAAVVVGALMVVFAWWLGPGLFGRAANAGTVVQAQVTTKAACTGSATREVVRFSYEGKTRDGTLDSCGHGEGEQLDVTVPDDAGDGTIAVSVADTTLGIGDVRRPVGLALLALSCIAGGYYAFLVLRGSRRRPVLV